MTYHKHKKPKFIKFFLDMSKKKKLYKEELEEYLKNIEDLE